MYQKLYEWEFQFFGDFAIGSYHVEHTVKWKKQCCLSNYSEFLESSFSSEARNSFVPKSCKYNEVLMLLKYVFDS